MKLTKSKLFGIVFLALFFVCSMICLITIKNVHATTIYFSGQSLNEYYKLNDELAIPQATFNVDGQSVMADALICYPSGKYVSKTQVTLDEAGKYTVEYKAVVNGTLYSEKKEFIVKTPLFSTETGSTVYFGAHKYTPDITGIVLSLKNYDVFHFNKIIDLSKMTKDDTLFNMYFTPEIIGQNDVNRIDFTFTDIYNPDNYITYTAKIYKEIDGNINTYSVAYANYQLPAGVEIKTKASTRPTMDFDGVEYYYHINNDYGAWSRITFTGVSANGLEIGQERMDVRFDYESKRFYADQLSCPEVYGKAEMIVTDLDDSRLYTNPWGGFTTGEVFMTISAKKYDAQTCNIVITDIAGEDLSVDGFVDETVPEITVDYGDLSYGYAPEGKVNKPYRIFDYSAFDVYTKNISLNSKVYYNYYTSNKINVPITNGAFTPDRAGIYTIVYTACDLFGNEQVKLVDVSVADDAESLTFELGSGVTEGLAGEQIQVKDYIASSTVSKCVVKIKAVNNDRSGIEYEINPETREFTPMYSGNYTVQYVCNDYVSSVPREYGLQVASSDKSLIMEEANLPKYFIKGCTYTLPALKAYNFSTGEPVETTSEIYAKADSGEYTKITGGKYQVPQAGNISIKYATRNNEKIYNIPVVDVGYGTNNFDKGKYFKGTNFTYQSKSDMISYTSGSNLASMEFVNSLLADGFTMIFSVTSLSSGFTGLDIYLTDIYDADKTVKCHFFTDYTKTRTYFKINDSDISYELGVVMGGSSNFELQYNANKKTISPYSGKNIEIKEYLNGDKFTGLSDKIYLKIEMTGGEDTVFNLKRLNGQVMDNAKKDVLAPTIQFVNILGYRELNDVITIAPSIAADVLCPEVTFHMSVSNPDGDYVRDENGELLENCYNTGVEHKIKLNMYGWWDIKFYACDSLGNVTAEDMGWISLYVQDMQPPVITVNPTQTEYDVNSEVAIATPTITDNKDKISAYSIIIYQPNTETVICSEATFIADVKGEYVIYYYCTDKAGNVGIASYTVYVK